MTNEEAFKELEAIARRVNPRIPDDLSGRTITIYASREGIFAYALETMQSIQMRVTEIARVDPADMQKPTTI